MQSCSMSYVLTGARGLDFSRRPTYIQIQITEMVLPHQARLSGSEEVHSLAVNVHLPGPFKSAGVVYLLCCGPALLFWNAR